MGALGDIVQAAAVYGWRGDARRREQLVDELGAAGSHEVSTAVTSRLLAAVADCWAHGWQPADLVHVSGKHLGAVHRRVCADAVALEARSYLGAPGADPDWVAQVHALEADPRRVDAGRALEAWADATGGDHRAALVTAVELLGLLLHLPTLPRLRIPPAEWGTVPTQLRASRCDPKITERVRALLAKAESTPFAEEAEALTAKAQELIAKHAIDRALLEEDGEVSDVAARRVPVDDPYARAKSLLLGVVAGANRCRSVWSGQLGFGTIFGLPADLDAVELLHASLLTQATAAMVTAGRRADGRTRSFRQSFLVAFAYRVGERLRAAADQVVDEARAEHGERLLPVLAARDEAVEAAMGEAFPQLGRNRVSTSNYAGWVAGQAAADLARLGPDAELEAG
jgi:hypothetical protein